VGPKRRVAVMKFAARADFVAQYGIAEAGSDEAAAIGGAAQ